jgi:hypothetical protein
MAHRSKAKPRTAGSGYESPPAGTSERYGLTHCHPGQIRNAYPKHNQADQARPEPPQQSHSVTKPVATGQLLMPRAGRFQ